MRVVGINDNGEDKKVYTVTGNGADDSSNDQLTNSNIWTVAGGVTLMDFDR